MLLWGLIKHSCSIVLQFESAFDAPCSSFVRDDVQNTSTLPLWGTPIFGGSFQNFTSDAVLLPQQAKQITEAKNLFQRIMTMQFRVSRGRCGRKVFRVTWPSMEKIPPGIYLVPVHALFFCPICLPPAQVAIGCQFSAKDVDHRDASSFSLEL